jgi:hypothetical protein
MAQQPARAMQVLAKDAPPPPHLPGSGSPCAARHGRAARLCLIWPGGPGGGRPGWWCPPSVGASRAGGAAELVEMVSQRSQGLRYQEHGAWCCAGTCLPVAHCCRSGYAVAQPACMHEQGSITTECTQHAKQTMKHARAAAMLCMTGRHACILTGQHWARPDATTQHYSQGSR